MILSNLQLHTKLTWTSQCPMSPMQAWSQ